MKTYYKNSTLNIVKGNKLSEQAYLSGHVFKYACSINAYCMYNFLKKNDQVKC